MRRNKQKMLVILILVVIIFSIIPINNKSYASTYTVTTQEYSSKNEFIKGNGGKWNGEEITDVTQTKKEYKYTYTKKETYNNTVDYKEKTFENRSEAMSYYNNNLKGKSYGGGTVIAASTKDGGKEAWSTRYSGYSNRNQAVYEGNKLKGTTYQGWYVDSFSVPKEPSKNDIGNNEYILTLHCTKNRRKLSLTIEKTKNTSETTEWTTKDPTSYFGTASVNSMTKTEIRYTYKVTTKKSTTDNSESSSGSSSGSSTETPAGNSSSGSSGSSSSSVVSSLDNFLFIGDSRYSSIASQISALGSNIKNVGVGSSRIDEWLTVANNSGKGTVQSTSVDITGKYSGISIQLGANSVYNNVDTAASKMEQFLNKLKELHPSTPIFVNSCLSVNSNATSSGYSWDVTKMKDCIKEFDQKISDFCNQNSDLYFVDISSGLEDENGFIKLEYENDGLHCNSTSAKIFAQNIKNAIIGAGVTNNSSSNTASSSISYVDNIEEGDTLKFTGYAWNTKSSDGGNNTGKFLSNGDLIKVIQKGDTANYLKIAVLSGELLDINTYIYYGNDASQYFEKVESAKVNDKTNSENEKQTETIDKGTATENAIAFAKLMYKGILGKTEEEANSYITADSSIVKDFLSGNLTAARLIVYLDDLDRPYGDLSFDEYCKYMYKAILQRDITSSELTKLKEQFGEDENFQSEVLGNIINSNEFKTLCEKYSINVGTYTAYKYNPNTTKEKATTFVKNLYSTLMNKTATDSDITKIVNNITEGKITASGVYKAFFESDEFKNQKVSDDKYIEMLGKVCWNKDLTDEQKKEYTNKLINGTTRNELLKEFISATDCTALCNEYGLSKGNYEAIKLRSTNALATDFVKNVHNATLGENSAMISSSNPGLITGSLSASDVIQLYVESSNFENRIKSENLTNSDYIKCLFKACLQRDASSADEAKQYENKIDQAYKPSVLAEFFKLDEYKKLCNSYYLVAGSYTDNKENNQAEPKTTSYGSGGAKITTKERKLSNGQTVKYTIKVEFDTSTGLKGDVDGDNYVGIEDASLLLSYVATQELNYIKPTDEVLKIADIDGDRIITIEDAQYILTYYAMSAAGLKPTWEEAIEASKKYDEDGTIPTKNTSKTEDKQNINTNKDSETVASKNFCVDITKSDSMPVCNEEQLTKMINNSDATQDAKNNMLSVVSDLVKYQNEYKVNAVFFMAVAKTESGWGTAWDKIDPKTHNWISLPGTKGGGYTDYDGKTWNSYSSYSEATKDWFELISDTKGYYFGSQKYTVDDIAPIYCNMQWGRNVSGYIQSFYSSIGLELKSTDNKESSNSNSDYNSNTEAETEKTGIKGIYKKGSKTFKIYLQNKGTWRDKPYWEGTFASEACAVSCIATIVSGYKNNDITPYDASVVQHQLLNLEADKNNPGLGSWDSWSGVLNYYGVQNSGFKKASKDEIIAHLKQGGEVIMNYSGSIGNRTTAGHIVTLLGMNSEGQIFVGDPVGIEGGYHDEADIFNADISAVCFID